MPTSVHDKAYLRALIGRSIKEEKIEKAIDALGMNIERQNAKEIEVEFQANRPDLISTVGLARALRYYMDRKSSFKYEAKGKSGIVVKADRKVDKLRPYITCLVAKNLNFTNSSFLDLINFIEKFTDTFGRRRKKIAVGLHDLDKLVPPISYTLASDEKFSALGIGEKSYSEILETTEKGKAYKDLCTTGDAFCVLKDQAGTMALIPVINSERTKITEHTKNIFVDITGTNSYFVNKAADLLACNFIDMGAKVYTVEVREGNTIKEAPKMETTQINVGLNLFKEEIGVFTLAFNNVIVLANKMGIEAALVGKEIRFTVPPYRLDIMNDQDIIEDVAVAYGYDYIQPFPIVSLSQGKLDPLEERNNVLREIMAGLGFFETMNSFVTNEDTNYAKMRLKPDSEYVRIKNAKTETITMLRSWLLPSLLSNLAKSQHESLPHKIFELDMTFTVRNGKPKETYHLAGVLSDSTVDLNEIKAIVEGVGKALSADLEVKAAQHNSFIDGRCGNILIKGKPKGVFGEIQPEVLENFGIGMPTVAFEIELED